jgi:hypothetical protein
VSASPRPFARCATARGTRTSWRSRIGFGLLLLNEAWLAHQAGYFGNRFYQPYLPEWLVPSEAVYAALVVVQGIAAAAVVVGRGARPALLVAAALLVYPMLCDRLWFHHYRHTLAAFCTLLAFAPCDRHLVLGMGADDRPAPLWARHAIRAQLMTPVRLFTAEMLLAYLLFCVPDAGARVVRFDAERHALAKDAIESLDWLRRFRLAPQEGASLAVVTRDGTELHGRRALAEAVGALPALFVAWPLFALVAAVRVRRGSPRRAS